jgi:hypothetical protein
LCFTTIALLADNHVPFTPFFLPPKEATHSTSPSHILPLLLAPQLSSTSLT